MEAVREANLSHSNFRRWWGWVRVPIKTSHVQDPLLSWVFFTVHRLNRVCEMSRITSDFLKRTPIKRASSLGFHLRLNKITARLNAVGKRGVSVEETRQVLDHLILEA